MFSIMYKYSKGYRKSTVMAGVWGILEVLFEVMIPTLMAYMIDVASKVPAGLWESGKAGYEFWDKLFVSYPELAAGNTLLWVLAGLSAVMAGLGLLCGIMAARCIACSGSGYSSNLRKALFSKIQGYSFSNIDNFSTAGLITRVTTDTNNSQNCYMMIIRAIFRAFIMIIFSSIMAFNMSAEISWTFLIIIPIIGIGVGLMASKAMPIYKYTLTRYDNMNNIVQENLMGIRAVKAFVREDHEREKYDKAASELRMSQLRAERILAFANPLIMMTMFALTATILLLGGQRIIGGTLASGALTSLITYGVQILMSVMMITMVIVQIVLARASMVRIKQALDEDSTIVDGQSNHTVASGKIQFKGVNFAYGSGKNNYVLKDINLTINSGETVGIIAGTGEGKSSLVSLIPRFYDVSEGEVLVDDVDVRQYNLSNLRDGVAMVLQKNVLFSGTIADNLRWGNENATDEQLVEACRIAQADKFISSFPDGYLTDLGQGGVNVSGGQKQRLCIARALLKKPKIMILDDSTSAVDTATDASIRDGLKKLNSSMTVIIIAQRISSIEDCDKIVVIDKGEISDIGNHDYLIKSNAIYQEVYHSQNRSKSDNKEGK